MRRSPAGDHSRSVVVTLTAAGHAVVERTVDLVLGREAYLVAGLLPAQRGQLIELLDQLLGEVAARVAEQPAARTGARPG